MNIRNSSRRKRTAVTVIAFAIGCTSASAQDLFAGFEKLFTTPNSYVVTHTQQKLRIDGRLNEGAWEKAPWSSLFVDIEGEGKPSPRLKTRVKLLWSDSCLYIGAELEEPHLAASLRKKDTIVYHDNDFEVFIDPDNNTYQYFEIEVNAYNTVLDLFMPKPYRDGGQANIGYDVNGLQSAVALWGTVNDASDKDSCWNVEMAIPFSSLRAGGSWRIPRAGDTWRINFSRVQWDWEVKGSQYVKLKGANGKALPEHNWVWSAQGVVNMHYPERWGYLVFSKKKPPAIDYVMPSSEKQKNYLWLVYYQQKAFLSKNGRYATSLEELGYLTDTVTVGTLKQYLSMQATPQQFTVRIQGSSTFGSINEAGFLQSSGE